MFGKIRQFAAFLLALTLCIGAAGAVPGEGDVAPTAEQQPVEAAVKDPYLDTKLIIGLAWSGSGVGTLHEAKLLIADGQGTGFRFGYFDADRNFVELARNEWVRALSMVKTTNMYLSGETFYTQAPSGAHKVLGCYHLRYEENFESFEAAREFAAEIDGAFVAWINGAYQVRRGSYTGKAEAEAAAEALAVTENTEDTKNTEETETTENTEQTSGNESEPQEPAKSAWLVCATSQYGVNVVQTGTTDILFQFDGGERRALGVVPGLADDDPRATWFKGHKYHGGFRYQRIGGGNLTVVNIMPLDTYLKGVVPYESVKIWPLETLKAQALCAKNYALINKNKHDGNGFDLCNTTDCQVYYGLGSSSSYPSALSDRAVEEVRGMYVWYGSKLAHTYFYSSNGGGSEDVSKVWGSNQATYPYLVGVEDIYEVQFADKIPSYRYSNSFTRAQLTDILHAKGYAIGTSVVDFQVTEQSRTGNAIVLKFIYANGKSNTFSANKSSWLRSKLGCRSLHFTVTLEGEYIAGSCAVNDNQTIRDLEQAYVISGDGTLTQLTGAEPYVIAGAGQVVSAKPDDTPTTEGKFVVSGSGWGHNVGYSQWGGYAMAQLGFTCDEILEFYFTGTRVGEYKEGTN